MERLTTRNSMGVAVLKTPYQCDRCGEAVYRMADYGDMEPIEKLARYEELQEKGLVPPCEVGDALYEPRPDSGIVEGIRIQKKIINRVLDERKRQDAKWGEQNHTAPVWGMIIGEEYGEMCQAINEFGFNPTHETEEQRVWVIKWD